MASKYIAESQRRAQERFIDTLAEHLPDELDAAESPDYPLPPPEAYLEEPENSYASMWRNLSVDEVAAVIAPRRPMQLVSTATGNSMEYEQHQDFQMTVQIVMRFRGGADLPLIRKGTPREREATMKEWHKRRVDKELGAAIHALTKHVIDGDDVADVTIDQIIAETFAEDGFGEVAVASCVVGGTQDVLIPMQ